MAAQWPAVAGHSAQWSRAVITRISISILALLALSLPASDADAQANADDFQIWTSMSLSGRLNSRLEIRGDGVFQATNDASRAGRELVRVVLLAQIDDRIMAGGGYVWTHVDAGSGAGFVEHRAVQEIDFRTSFADNVASLILRTQVEERWREAQRGCRCGCVN